MKLSVPPANAKGKVLMTLDGGWTCRRVRAYVIGDHNFEVRPVEDDPPVAIRLGDWRQFVGEGFSGDVEYTTTFTCEAYTATNAVVLDLGDVKSACSVELNHQRLGTKIWPCWHYSIPRKLKAGVNQLKVIVSNTMANQYVTTRALNKWKPWQLGPYHSRALNFERDSLQSGLYGPVTFSQ